MAGIENISRDFTLSLDGDCGGEAERLRTERPGDKI